MEPPIPGEEDFACSTGCGQKVNINPPKAAPVQPVDTGKAEHIRFRDDRQCWQGLHRLEYLIAVSQVTAGDFSHDERVHRHQVPLEKIHERGVTATQMVHPDCCIDQH
jgi:hypothetical protein